MRTEQEMLELILGFAEREDRIRAVYLNGSRANPGAPRDIFQDFDVVYVVTETEPYILDKAWLKAFGELVVMQEPDINVLYASEPTDPKTRYAYLMQFMDGNRIDLTLQTVEASIEECKKEKLTLLLLDKEGVLPRLSVPSDEDYHVKRPSRIGFDHCCNEFWWVSPYVAKGLWRGELLYAMDHLNLYVRPMLLMMLFWYAGILTDFSLSVGKNGKYLDKFLPDKLWKKLLMTYPPAEPEKLWDALMGMGELFRETAVFVGEAMGYEYDFGQDHRTMEFVKDIQKLPKDASEIR